MMPFLCSIGGGSHERITDVDDGEEPLGLTGDAEGPIRRGDVSSSAVTALTYCLHQVAL